MLKYYLESISCLEFSERNIEIPLLIAQNKNDMNARGVLYSTITLQSISIFFTEEFYARCDFVKEFIISYSNLANKNDSDILTDVKTLFQSNVFDEKNNLLELYNRSVKTIEESLSNDNMKHEIKRLFVSRMDERIKKNNLYIEVTIKVLKNNASNKNNSILLQPNFHGIGIDLLELWNRHIKKT